MSDKTDRQTDKSSRWAFTAYEDQWSLFEAMPPGVAEWGWNAEVCPKTNRKHYQGYLRLTQQQRFAWLRKLLPGVHIEVSKNWEALKLYCQKEETRIPGTDPVAQTSNFLTHYQYVDLVAKTCAEVIESYGMTVASVSKEKMLKMVEAKVCQDIMQGKRWAGHIAANPQWNALWNKYVREYFISFSSINGPQVSCSPQGPSPRQEGEDVSLNG